jgi:iron(III) transport system substrate-binding protein
MSSKPVSRRLLIKTAALAGAGLPLARLPAFAQSTALPELAAYQGADRTEKLVEGAKKEGTLTFYTSAPVDDMKILTEEFEKKYGVKVRLLARQLREHPAADRGGEPRPPLRGRRDRYERS